MISFCNCDFLAKISKKINVGKIFLKKYIRLTCIDNNVKPLYIKIKSRFRD